MKPGDLIIDNHGRQGIVLRRAYPAQDWLNDQSDERIRSLPKDTVWWEALPLVGGGIFTPEPFTEFVREATREDFRTCSENANRFGREELSNLAKDPRTRIVEAAIALVTAWKEDKCQDKLAEQLMTAVDDHLCRVPGERYFTDEEVAEIRKQLRIARDDPWEGDRDQEKRDRAAMEQAAKDRHKCRTCGLTKTNNVCAFCEG